jgi:large subunit ribosomal protein L17
MRKRKKGRKFHREKSQRKALLIGLANNLFLKEKIRTTQAKAKELSAISEKYITKAKKMDLTKKRLLLRDLTLKVVNKLEKEIAPRYKTRQGGYTRIIKLGRRIKSDGAKMAIIELIK